MDDIEPWVFSTHKFSGLKSEIWNEKRESMGNNMDLRMRTKDRERERATKRIAKATTRELDNYPQKTLCSVCKVCQEILRHNYAYLWFIFAASIHHCRNRMHLTFHSFVIWFPFAVVVYFSFHFIIVSILSASGTVEREVCITSYIVLKVEFLMQCIYVGFPLQPMRTCMRASVCWNSCDP